MTTTQLISDAAKWPRIAASRQQHADIQKWLLANGVDPYDVLAGGTVAIEDLGMHGRRIRYEHLLRDQQGNLLRSTDSTLLCETRTAPLVIGPPASLVTAPSPVADVEAPPPAAGDDATAAAQAAPALSTGQDTSPVTPPEES
jgi:hypothetical protein